MNRGSFRDEEIISNSRLVVHSKAEKYDVYIGRPGPFGNPFVIGPDGSARITSLKISSKD